MADPYVYDVDSVHDDDGLPVFVRNDYGRVVISSGGAALNMLQMAELQSVLSKATHLAGCDAERYALESAE